jgi:hypothetical protein
VGILPWRSSWNSSEKFVRTLGVVSREPLGGHAANLAERVENVAIEHLGAVGAVEPHPLVYWQLAKFCKKRLWFLVKPAAIESGNFLRKRFSAKK